MPIDSSLIGKSSEPQTFLVSREAVERFMEATEDPALHSEKLLEHAPPTFPTTFRVPLPVEIDMSHVLHGEQEYAYTRPIVAGETIRCQTKIVKVYERDGSLGKMIFLTAEIAGNDAQGQPAFTGRSIIILHEGGPAK